MEVLREKLASYFCNNHPVSHVLRPVLGSPGHRRWPSALVREVLRADVQGRGLHRCPVRGPHDRDAGLEAAATEMTSYNGTKRGALRMWCTS